jgi:hypothetical protein
MDTQQMFECLLATMKTNHEDISNVGGKDGYNLNNNERRNASQNSLHPVRAREHKSADEESP